VIAFIIATLAIGNCLLTLVFVGRYLFRPWWTTPPGRAIMLFAVGLLGSLVLAAYRYISGEQAPEWMRAISYGIGFAALAYLNITLTGASRRRAERNNELEEMH